MNTSLYVKIHTQVDKLNRSLKISQPIVHKILFYFNAGIRYTIAYTYCAAVDKRICKMSPGSQCDFLALCLFDCKRVAPRLCIKYKYRVGNFYFFSSAGILYCSIDSQLPGHQDRENQPG
jgi:hypothetical protein